MSKSYSQNVQIILDVLEDEVKGRTKEAYSKLHKDYTNTYMNNCFDRLFNQSGVANEKDLEDVYIIKGRKYEIYNITESENTVMIEMIESYPDPKTGKIYRTPQVIVSEIEDGLIKNGRHYNDPALSFMELSDEDLSTAYRNKKPILVIS